MKQTQRTDPGNRALLVLAFVAPGIFFMLIFILRSGFQDGRWFFTLFDDAMISMTYARTLADTGELVWFPNADRVQGISNLLWTLGLSLVHVAGIEGSDAALLIQLLAVVLVCLAAAVVNMAVAGDTGRLPSPAFSYAAAATLLMFFPLIYWSLRGMEVSLLALLVSLSVYMSACLAVTRKQWVVSIGLAAVGVIGVLTRIDFLIYFLACLFGSLALSRLKTTTRFVLPGTVAVLAVICLLAWQYVYYGDALPNTSTLKLSGIGFEDRIIRGLGSSAKGAPWLVMAWWGFWLSRIGLNSRASRLALTGSSVMTVGFAYSVWVGGDAWESFGFLNRYLTVAVPGVVISVFVGMRSVRNHSFPMPWIRYVLVASPILTISGLVAGFQVNPTNYDVSRGLIQGSLMAVLSFLPLLMRPQWTGTFCSKRGIETGVAITMLILMTLLSASGRSPVPYKTWLNSGAEYVGADYGLSMLGTELHSVTKETASLAILSAGSVIYYSDRSGVDLLGKNDRNVASMQINSQLPEVFVDGWIPGHTKWDYTYSIQQLKPTIVLQTWGEAGTGLALTYWGYSRLCLPSGYPLWVSQEGIPQLEDDLVSC